MNDQIRLLIAIVLSILILVGARVYFPPQQNLQQNHVLQTTANSAPALPSPATAVETPVPAADVLATTKAQRIPFANAALTGSINRQGARIDDATLTQYHETLRPDSAPISLLLPSKTAHPFFAEFGWVSPDSTLALPTSKTLWTIEGANKTLTPNQPVTLMWDNGQNVVFRIAYALDAHYMINVTQSVTNKSGMDISVTPFSLLRRAGMANHPHTRQDKIVHEGLVGFFNDELIESSYDDLREEPIRAAASTGGWLGITDKYWAAFVIPPQNQAATFTLRHVEGQALDTYQTDIALPAAAIPHGQTHAVQQHLFVGAKKISLLDQYEQTLNIPHLDLVVDFGWFYIISKPLFYLVNYFFGLVGNFGIAIILLTIVVRVIFFPLSNKSYRTMNRMKELQPKITALKERYKNEPQKFQMEMMTLYKTEKLNPAAGCLPILIQIPVFFALYKMLSIAIEMRHQPFFGWIRDLSATDPTTFLNLFGLIPFTPPAFLGVISIGAWPLLLGLSMYIQQKLNPAPTDKIQASLLKWMPIVFTFILAHFPAGLVIYWTTSNILAIGQQSMMRRLHPPAKGV